MPDIFIPKNYQDDQPLFESNIDDVRSSLLDFFNSIKLSNSNILDDSLTADNIVDESITLNLLDNNFTDNTTLEMDAVSGIQLVDSGVSTAKIADNTLERSKRTYNIQKSSSSGTYTRSSASWGNITNLQVSITTTGRPVFVGLMPANSASNSYFSVADASDGIDSLLRLTRDGSQIGGQIRVSQSETVANTSDITRIYAADNASGLQARTTRIPVGCLYHIDKPSQGTYTYRAQANNSAPGSNKGDLYVESAVLVAMEL